MSFYKALLKALTCDSGGIQTHNLLIRSQMLYSVELRSHFLNCVCKGIYFFDKMQIYLFIFSIESCTLHFFFVVSSLFLYSTFLYYELAFIWSYLSYISIVVVVIISSLIIDI